MADEKAKKTVSSVEDRVKEIEDKLARHKEQEQKLNAMKQGIINREKEKERKARTRRLIQNGALSEQYLRCDGMSPDTFERLMKVLGENKAFNDFLNQCLTRLNAENKPVNASSTESVPVSVVSVPTNGSPVADSRTQPVHSLASGNTLSRTSVPGSTSTYNPPSQASVSYGYAYSEQKK